MNINGKEGPTLKKLFTCEYCKYLGSSVLGNLGRKQYKCYYNKETKTDTIKNLKLIDGDIDSSKITPDFCPFLIKELRFEKLNELRNIK